MITGELPLRIEVDVGKTYHPADPGVIDFRLEATGAVSIQDVWLGVRGAHGLDLADEVSVAGLRAGQVKSVGIGWQPQRVGELVARVLVTVREADSGPSVFVGTFRVQVRDRAGASSVGVNVNIHGDKFQGVDLSHLVNLHGVVPETIERHEPCWLPIDLDFDEMATRNRQRTVRRLIQAGREPATALGRASLTLGGKAQRRIDILTCRPLRFGRHSQNDVVLRFLPDDDDHQAMSERLSRNQFILDVNREGVLLTSRGSSGAYLNERLLPQDAPVPFPRGSCRLTAGLMGLELLLDVMPGRIDDDAQRTLSFLCDQFHVVPGAQPPADAVRIRRVNNAPELEYCWFLSVVDIGSDQTCAIRVADATSPAKLARLTTIEGRFFLETLSDTGETVVDGSVLNAGDVVALGVSHDLQIGGVDLRWEC